MAKLTFNHNILKIGTTTINYNLSDSPSRSPSFSTFKHIANYIKDSTANGINYKKVIFIIRHSKRDRDHWETSVPLTPLGVNGAIKAGSTIIDLQSTDYNYYSTNTVRTRETAYYISYGRQDNKVSSPEEVRPHYQICGDNALNFIKDENIYNELTNIKGYNRTWYEYIYGADGIPHVGENTAFNEFNFVCDVFNTTIINNAPLGTSFVAMHDQNIMPYVAYMTNNRIDFRINNRWLNYMAGITLLVTDTEMFAIPTCGLISGYN